MPKTPPVPPDRRQEREFLLGLRWAEKSAILPLKWAILATAVAFWLLSHPGATLPPVDVFSLFTFYTMFTLGESYLFWLSRVAVSQVRAACLTSYAVDVIFVTLLIFFDARRYPSPDGSATDFYIFYFLLILRSVALFRTARGNLAANAAVAAVFVLTLVWQDTSPEWYSARNSVIRAIFVGLVIMMAWFIVNIINRQNLELMRAREDLVRSENMAAVGELAAGVAHEINNPIGIISAYADYLQKNAPEDDARREDFQVISNEARRCERIVQELLNYARPTTPGRSLVDLRKLCDEVLEFVSKRPGSEGVVVTRDYPDEITQVMIDANQMKQALLNVMLNAYQAVAAAQTKPPPEPKPRPGHQKLGARLADDEVEDSSVGELKAVRASLLPNKGAIKVIIRDLPERGFGRIQVIDTGKGIAPEELLRVFDPFYTTRHEGTGLGLAITRRMIEAQGGKIEIASVPGHGTTVELFVPLETTSTE